MRRTIESELLPAYERGDVLSVIEYASNIANSVAPERWPSISKTLESNGLPALGALLVDGRLDLIQANYGGVLPPPSPRETDLLLPALDERLKKDLEDIRQRAGLDARIRAENLDDFEELLWTLHVSRNQLLAIHDLIAYGQQLAKTRREPDAEVKLQRFQDLARQLTLLQAQLYERTVEARVERVKKAESVLATDDDLVQRFKAAWVIDVDGELIETFLRERGTGIAINSKLLSDPTLPDVIQTTVASAR